MSISPTTRRISRAELLDGLGQLLLASLLGLAFLLPLLRGAVWPLEQVFIHWLLLLLWVVSETRNHLSGRGALYWLNRSRLLLLIPLLAASGYGLAVFNARIPASALLEHTGWISAILALAIAISICRQPRRRELFLSGFAFLTSGFALHGLWLFSLREAPEWWEKASFLSGTYVNHNHFAGLLELGAGLLLGFCLSRQGLVRILAAMGLVILLTALIFSMSRGAWISLYLALVSGCLILMSDRLLRRRALQAVLVLIFLPVLFLAAMSQSDTLKTRLESFMSQEGQYEFQDFRLKLWQSTLAAIQARPLEGFGPGSFGYEMLPYRQKGFEFKFDYAHCDWLQLGMEYGLVQLILGLLVVLVFWCSLMKRCVASSLNALRFEEWGAGVGLLALMIHGLVDFNLHIPGNRILALMLFGAVLIPARESRRQGPG